MFKQCSQHISRTICMQQGCPVGRCRRLVARLSRTDPLNYLLTEQPLLKEAKVRGQRTQVGHRRNIATRKTKVNLRQWTSVPDGPCRRRLGGSRQRSAALQGSCINNQRSQVTSSVLTAAGSLYEDIPVSEKCRHRHASP